MHAILHIGLSVGRSISMSVRSISKCLTFWVFKGTLGYLRLLQGTLGYLRVFEGTSGTLGYFRYFRYFRVIKGSIGTLGYFWVL